MLSEEEKQAMKYFYNLRATIDESNMLFDEDIDVKCGKETIKQITTILNLIKKLSKEIEELKEKNKYIEDRAKIGKNIQTFINKDYVEQEYISKAKIKAKIEEYEDYGTSIYYGLRSNGKAFHQAVRMEVKAVLQSLLEDNKEDNTEEIEDNKEDNTEEIEETNLHYVICERDFKNMNIVKN